MMRIATVAAFLLVMLGGASGRGAENLPPIAQIISPTNHTEFHWSDGVGRFLVSVHVFDPEGSISSVQVEVSGRIIVTNRLGDYEVDFGYFQPESGEVKLKVTDDQGVIATDTISFTAVQEPWFPSVLLHISWQGDKLLISASNGPLGFLQESSDWVLWSDVARLDTNQFIISPNANRRFYRIQFQ